MHTGYKRLDKPISELGAPKRPQPRCKSQRRHPLHGLSYIYTHPLHTHHTGCNPQTRDQARSTSGRIRDQAGLDSFVNCFCSSSPCCLGHEVERVQRNYRLMLLGLELKQTEIHPSCVTVLVQTNSLGHSKPLPFSSD